MLNRTRSGARIVTPLLPYRVNDEYQGLTSSLLTTCGYVHVTAENDAALCTRPSTAHASLAADVRQSEA